MTRRTKTVLLATGGCLVVAVVIVIAADWYTRTPAIINAVCTASLKADERAADGVESVKPCVQEIERILGGSLGQIRARDMNGSTVLHWVSNEWVAEYLISKGADVNARNKEGNTPLHICVIGRDAKVARVLLEHGADVNARNNGNKTPTYLFMALYAPVLERGPDGRLRVTADEAGDQRTSEMGLILKVFGGEVAPAAP